MNPLLLINVAIGLMEAIERGNSAVLRMQELRNLAEAGKLTDEHLQEVQDSLEKKAADYRSRIGAP